LAFIPVIQWPSLTAYLHFKKYWFLCAQILQTSQDQPINKGEVEKMASERQRELASLLAALHADNTSIAGKQVTMTPPELGGLGGTFWSTLVGAVVGAVVAGVINLLIQLKTITAARMDRSLVQRQADLGAAFGVMVKVIKMLSHIHHIRGQITLAKQQ